MSPRLSWAILVAAACLLTACEGPPWPIVRVCANGHRILQSSNGGFWAEPSVDRQNSRPLARGLTPEAYCEMADRAYRW